MIATIRANSEASKWKYYAYEESAPLENTENDIPIKDSDVIESNILNEDLLVSNSLRIIAMIIKL